MDLLPVGSEMSEFGFRTWRRLGSPEAPLKMGVPGPCIFVFLCFCIFLYIAWSLYRSQLHLKT